MGVHMYVLVKDKTKTIIATTSLESLVARLVSLRIPYGLPYMHM
jgi:hypothetical protein